MIGPHIAYRPEVDGLRAISVLAVILYHAGFTTPSGGFIGVDIFFVISGYLITSIILNDLRDGTFSFLSFYERRARRILPALFLVLLVCLPFAWHWFLPGDMEEFTRSVIAVATFSSNVLFWRESGYFDTAAELKPLLHTWSLAVEEQYYILFPILMVFLFRYSRKLIGAALVILMLASLAASQWGAYNEPTATFYLLPTRGWELLVGSLAALHLQYNRQSDRVLLSRSMELIGLAGIFLSIFLFTKNTPHPSIYTLVPTISVALIILFSRPGSLVHGILGSRILSGIGLISYSLYLWHFPVFAFYRYRFSENPTDGPWLLMIALIFALSYASWRYVETPFRNRTVISGRRIFVSSGLASLMFLTFGIGGQVTQGYVSRSQMDGLEIAIPTVEDVYCHNSGNRSISQIRSDDICTVGDGPVRTAVIGDSHAGALFDALDDLGKRHEEGYWTFSDAFCPPVIGFVLNEYGSKCAAKRDASFEKIVRNDSIKSVILVANWGLYTQGYRDDLMPSGATLDGTRYDDNLHNPALFSTAMSRTVDYLVEHGKEVFILGPAPEFSVDVYQYILKSRLFDDDIDAQSITTPVENYEARNSEVFEAFSDIENVRVMPIDGLFCDLASCQALSDCGEPLFSDTNHVNRLGADIVVNFLYNGIL